MGSCRVITANKNDVVVKGEGNKDRGTKGKTITRRVKGSHRHEERNERLYEQLYNPLCTQ